MSKFSRPAGSADKTKKQKNGPIFKRIIAVNVVVALIFSLYLFILLTEDEFFGGARDLWIETAMTTADHQWLATKIFPGWLIRNVMSKQVFTDEGTLSNPNLSFTAAAGGSQGGAQDAGEGLEWRYGNGNGVGGASGGDHNAQSGAGTDGQSGAQDGQSGPSGTGFGDWLMRGADSSRRDAVYADSSGKYKDTRPDTALPGIGFFQNIKDFAGAERYNMYPSVGDVDMFGNVVIISDEAEDIYVVELQTSGYTGRIMFVPDPSRVVVRQTRNKDAQGQFIKTYLKEHNAIAGMNGNGFDDPEGSGKGGSIIGWSVANGSEWGEGPKSQYASVGFNDQNVLMVGVFKDFKTHKIRDLAQYGPTLIVDGKKLISGSGGWGLQPRTAIGQLGDGTVLLATFDGRQPGHSIGITAGEIADIFYDYGCVNAGLCDGGSSSVMMYDGDIVGKPSTPMKDTGRYLPNAFLVLSIAGAPPA